MKFSISNIAWPIEWDKDVFNTLKDIGFHAIEIAPNRTINNGYHSTNEEIFKWYKLYSEYYQEVSSMQSLLFNVKTQIFESDENMTTTLEILEQGIEFASKLKVSNVVFGSPSIRNVNNNLQRNRSIIFFNQLSKMAEKYQINVALEPNPKIYNTNFLNTTSEAFEFVKQLNIANLGINFDFGTIIENKESIESIITEENIRFIKHVHISEPFLVKIDFNQKKNHLMLFRALKASNYKGYISIEMKSGCSFNELIEVLEYVKAIGIEAGVWNEKQDL